MIDFRHHGGVNFLLILPVPIGELANGWNLILPVRQSPWDVQIEWAALMGANKLECEVDELIVNVFALLSVLICF